MPSVAPALSPALRADSEDEYTLTGTSCWVTSGDQSLLICRTGDTLKVMVYATGREDQHEIEGLSVADHQAAQVDALSTLWETAHE